MIYRKKNKQTIWINKKDKHNRFNNKNTQLIAMSLYIKKFYDKMNQMKTLKKLENIGIQERMLEFIRKLVSEKRIKVRVGETSLLSKQTDHRIPKTLCLGRS